MKAISICLALAVATAGLSAGCTRAQAKATLEPPLLNMPVPPPRVVESPVIEAAAPPPAAQEPVVNVAPPPPAPPPARPARAAEPKPSEPVEAVTKPEEAPRPATPALQALSPREVLERDRIKNIINGAIANLKNVTASRLDSNARNQYEIAMGLVRQAEEAVTANNLVFARSLADRAATLAAQLR